LLAERYPIRDM